MVEKLKSVKTKKAFAYWKACIFSGVYVRITLVEGHAVPMGFCRNPLKNRYIDFEIECVDCKKRKTKREPPKHVRTPTRKARISTARRRSIAKRKDLFNPDKWRRPRSKH